MLRIIENMYCNISSKVHTSAGTSEVFTQANDLMQGECLSPTLFSLYINEIESIMNSINQMGVEMGGVKISVLKYADDLVLISTSKDGLQEELNALCTFCEKNSLTVNKYKSHVMYVSKRKPRQLSVMFYNNTILDWVDNFRYLGVC